MELSAFSAYHNPILRLNTIEEVREGVFTDVSEPASLYSLKSITLI